MKDDIKTLVEPGNSTPVYTAYSEILADRLRSVAHGDHEAFEEVYRRTSAKLFGICLQILPGRPQTEDVIQDVYCSVWRSAALFDEQRGTQ